jgi:transposase InsO family protein
MGRRGNTYDNAKAESFMKNLTVEAPEIFPALSMRSISLARSIPR